MSLASGSAELPRPLCSAHEMAVLLVHSPAPRQWHTAWVVLPHGATVAQALMASGWHTRWVLPGRADVALSVWGRRSALEAALEDGDRLEICRALRVDPKAARRERAARGQATRRSGGRSQGAPSAVKAATAVFNKNNAQSR